MINIEVLYDDIYIRCYPAVVRFAMAKGYSRAIAEEIANETMERLWRRRLECNFENEVLLRAWTYKAAGLVMLEQDRKTPNNVDLNICESYISETDKIDEHVENLQYEQYIAKIEQNLSASEQMLFRMVFIEKKSYAICADEFQVRQVTVRANISRLRKKLRPFISEMFEETKQK